VRRSLRLKSLATSDVRTEVNLREIRDVFCNWSEGGSFAATECRTWLEERTFLRASD
jgi:hypothetical protein